MNNNDPYIIKDEEELVSTRFVSFKGDYYRYDLAVMSSDRFGNDKMVIDLNENRFILLNKQSLTEYGYLEHTLQLTEVVADDLRRFLKDII